MEFGNPGPAFILGGKRSFSKWKEGVLGSII
jgi:hypothetical protein